MQEIFIGLFALFAIVLFCWCMHEAFVAPVVRKNKKAEEEMQARIEREAAELEKRLKESRERNATLVEPKHKQQRATPAAKPKGGSPIYRERDAEEPYMDNSAVALAVIMASEPEPSYEPEPVQKATYDDRSFTSYSSPGPSYESKRDDSWTSYDSDSSSSSSYDSSSSSPSSNWD